MEIRSTAVDFAHSGREAELIVLAKIDHRELPQARDIQRLMKNALIGRPVPEEDEADLAAAAQQRGKRGARAEPDAGPDNTVRAEDALVERGDVHRAAEAAAIAGVAAHQLRHHAGHVGTFGDTMSMTAMVGDDIVSGLESGAGTDSDGLLADA